MLKQAENELLTQVGPGTAMDAVKRSGRGQRGGGVVHFEGQLIRQAG